MDAPTHMTWKQFTDKVKENLPVDRDRIGYETFLANMIVAGVKEMQHFCKQYQLGHETIYIPSDFAQEGSASKGHLPPGAKVQRADLVWVVEEAAAEDLDGNDVVGETKAKRYALAPLAWDRRHELTFEQAAVNGGNGFICIDPHGHSFYVYPEVTDGWMLTLYWDGKKVTFKDDEETPFDDQMALAVAHFVKAKFSLEVQEDVTLHREHNGAYVTKRRELIRDGHEQAMVNK